MTESDMSEEVTGVGARRKHSDDHLVTSNGNRKHRDSDRDRKHRLHSVHLNSNNIVISL